MKVRFIPIEALLEMQENNEPHELVFVLPKEVFDKGHIPGSLSIPLDQLEERAPNELDKNKPVIVYCASYECQASTKAARKLMEMGYGNVLDFKAGTKGWEDAGLQLEKA